MRLCVGVCLSGVVERIASGIVAIACLNHTHMAVQNVFSVLVFKISNTRSKWEFVVIFVLLDLGSKRIRCEVSNLCSCLKLQMVNWTCSIQNYTLAMEETFHKH